MNMRYWSLLIVIIVAIVLVLLLMFAYSAQAETKVWGLRGAGFEAWSSGVDDIAAQARTIPGVSDVRVFNYYETQQVYNEIEAAKVASPRVRVAIYGYSCGANAAVVIANSFRRNINEVLGMQPSVWCGGGYQNHINNNTGYQQNTFAPCWQTLGLGCQQWSGGRRSSSIQRESRHLYADTDPAYQQDVLGSISYLAGYQLPPCSGHRCHGHTLIVHRAPGGGVTHRLLHQ